MAQSPEDDIGMLKFENASLKSKLKEYELSPGILKTTSDWVKKYLLALFQYFPTSLVMFGFISDAINEDFRYSLASIIGILSVILNYLIGGLAKTFFSIDVTKLQTNTNCSVPGFQFLDSPVSPQGIVLPVAIFSYLFIDFGLNRSPSENSGTAGLFLLFFGIHLVVMYSNKCFDAYYGVLLSILIAIFIGFMSGLFGWIGVHSLAPERLPSASYNYTPSSSSNDSGPTLGPGGTPVSSVETCSAPNDQDQFVCDLYKNGELITSTISS